MPYDAGGLEPSVPMDEWCEHPENSGASSAPEAPGLPLPPPGQLDEWLRAIEQRDGLEALLKALLRTVSKDHLMETTERLCNTEWGEEPLIASGIGAVRWEQASPARSTTSTVGTIALQSRPSYTGEAASLYRFRRCWHCEPDFGRQDDCCRAQEVLGSLEAEAEEQDEEVQEADVQAGEASRLARRAARYYLYRKWVYSAHGTLGKRVRVRIPRCVVELIRNRYREPDCRCAVGGALYECTEHGYTGHREAVSDAEDESM